jgi:hypothetical protein
LLFDPVDSPERIAAEVFRLFNSRESYEKMAASSRSEFEERLNWDSAGVRIGSILEGIVRQPVPVAVSASAPALNLGTLPAVSKLGPFGPQRTI